jgi:cytochrome c oxidase subunit 2
MKSLFRLLGITSLVLVAIGAASAYAAYPIDWGIGMQQAASPVKERMDEFHTLIMWIITGIVLLVSFLMVYIMIRFRAKANPVPSKTSHNVMLEIIWTAIPVAILIVICIPSMKLLYYTDRGVETEMTVKVTGYQWYWGYDYPEHGDISYTAYMIPDEDIDESKGQKRLLSTDNQLVLPIDTNILIQVTAADVIHSYAVPAFGIKKDAVPGRLNETWVRITEPGRYYGQCSEICGTGHAYMPSEIVAVSIEDFDAWAIAAQEEFINFDEFQIQRQQLANNEEVQ